MKTVSGGVCAAKGFTAAGVHCGIRKNKSKKDLSLIFSEVPASAAAVYTTNLVKGAPLLVTKSHLSNGKAQAVICNSGNANTCNANGVEIAEQTCALLADELGIDKNDVVVASTGVIGQPLDFAPIASGIPQLHATLGDCSLDAAEGIMTTDTKVKEIAVSFEIGGVECKIGGIAKVGTFTGYYYTATFSAQIATPIIYGIVRMFTGTYMSLFYYCPIAFILSALCILVVKHGEAIPDEIVEAAREENED